MKTIALCHALARLRHFLSERFRNLSRERRPAVARGFSPRSEILKGTGRGLKPRAIPIMLCLALALFATSAVAAEPAAAPPAEPVKEKAWEVALKRFSTDDPVREKRWAVIQKLLSTYPKTDHTVDRRQNSIERDQIYRTLREKGLEFWDAYPKDPRRYTWLSAMENRGFVPNYRDAKLEFDPGELRTWRARRPALRAEFLASPQVTSDQRVVYRFNELRFDVLYIVGGCQFGADLKPETAARLTLESVVDDILEFADTHPAPEQCTNARVKVGRYPVDAMTLLLGSNPQAGTPEWKQTLAKIVPRMLDSKLEYMRRYGASLQTTLLSEHVLSVTGRTLTGEDFDLARYRGKLVLLDCWATWCAPCIAEMPALKKMEERFGPQGFAIVGVSLDTAATRPKVLEVLKSTGATWPQIAEANELSRRLGCRAVPYTLLVGRDGKVIAAGSFSLRELETLVAREIGKNQK